MNTAVNPSTEEAFAAVPRVNSKPWMAVIGRGLGVGSAFLVTAALGRLLAESDYSDFQMLLTLLTPASWIAVLGLNASAVRLIGEETTLHGVGAGIDLTRKMLWFAAGCALAAIPLTGIVMWVGTHYLGFPLPSETKLLVVFAVTVAMIGFQQVLADCYNAHHELGSAPLFTGGLMAGPVSTLLFLVCFLGWAYLERLSPGAHYTKELWGVNLSLHCPTVLQSMLSLLVALGISLPIAGWGFRQVLHRLSVHVKPRVTSVAVTHIFQIGVSLLGMSLAAYFLTVLVDVWIASKVFRDVHSVTQTKLDWYFAARRLTFMAFITLQLAGSLVSPRVAKLYFSDQRAALQTQLQKFAWYGGLPAWCAVGLFLFVPKWLLTTYLGDRFGGAANAAQILAVAPLFAAWAGHGGYALAVTRHQNYCIGVNVLAGLFVLLAGFPAAAHWGLEGLAMVSVIGFVLKHGAEWWLTHRLLGVWCHMGWSSQQHV